MIYVLLLIKTWLPSCFLVRQMLCLSFYKAKFLRHSIMRDDLILSSAQEGKPTPAWLSFPDLQGFQPAAPAFLWDPFTAESSISAGNAESALRKQMFPEPQWQGGLQMLQSHTIACGEQVSKPGGRQAEKKPFPVWWLVLPQARRPQGSSSSFSSPSK